MQISKPPVPDADRWEYILMAGTNRPPEPKDERPALEGALTAIGSTPALIFLSVILTVVAIAPQAPGAHDWAAERAAQSAQLR